MEVPYTRIDLTIAMISAGRKLEAFEIAHGVDAVEKVMSNIMKDFQQDPYTDNPGAAAFHGVTVETLVDSPNYETLKKEFAASVVKRLIGALTKEFGIEDKEAWALMLSSQI